MRMGASTVSHTHVVSVRMGKHFLQAIGTLLVGAI